MVLLPVATRSISNDSEGMILPCAMHDHRHAPDDAVALGLDSEQPAPGGGVFEDRNILQQPGEAEHEGLRIAAQRRHADRQRLRVG